VAGSAAALTAQPSTTTPYDYPNPYRTMVTLHFVPNHFIPVHFVPVTLSPCPFVPGHFVPSHFVPWSLCHPGHFVPQSLYPRSLCPLVILSPVSLSPVTFLPIFHLRFKKKKLNKKFGWVGHQFIFFAVEVRLFYLFRTL
jgi:hypothetical protein